MISNHKGLDSGPEEFTKQYASRYPLTSYQQSHRPEYDARLPSYVSTAMNAKGPILPPIQTRERPVSQYNQVQSKQSNIMVPPKEDKPVVGGVAAHLDYEMEQMVDFVSESAQGMYALSHTSICFADIDVAQSLIPNTSVPPAFRKYVSQVLSSTRLPSSTILYGLYYLDQRMTALSKEGRYPNGNSGHIYRMLTTALLLGSKFLDDNTFQNRSWSEVSNISVQELNILELEWLKSMQWGLHIDFNDPEGFELWDLKWKQFKAARVNLSIESLKLNPLNSNIQGHPSAGKRISPTLPYPVPYNEPSYTTTIKDRLPLQWSNARYDARYDEWSAPPSATRYSPPSAPHTGPTTPECYGRGWYNNDYKSYGSSNVTTPASAQSFQTFIQQASYQKPYLQQYAVGPWSSHNAHCGCGYCVPHHETFNGSFQHRSQTVAG